MLKDSWRSKAPNVATKQLSTCNLHVVTNCFEQVHLGIVDAVRVAGVSVESDQSRKIDRRPCPFHGHGRTMQRV